MRIERGLTLEQLAEQTGLSRSAWDDYEADEFMDIGHHAIIKLAKFYDVTADYLLGLSETKSHPNTDPASLRLSDEMVDLLKNRQADHALLCDLAAHPNFVKLVADQSLVENISAMQIQNCRKVPAGRA